MTAANHELESERPSPARRDAPVTLLGLGLLLTWDAAGLLAAVVPMGLLLGTAQLVRGARALTPAAPASAGPGSQ